jgi:citronellol/citronellal dehydrogenase
MRLNEKVAIVTGASRGIGKAIAIGLAREGARVVLAARSEIARIDGLDGTIHETAQVIEEFGGQALPVKCDVTDEATVVTMVKTTEARFGHVDILVNNAGVAFFIPLRKRPLNGGKRY